MFVATGGGGKEEKENNNEKGENLQTDINNIPYRFEEAKPYRGDLDFTRLIVRRRRREYASRTRTDGTAGFVVW